MVLPKNLIAFNLPRFQLQPGVLEAQLQKSKLGPLGPQDLTRAGFVSPFGRKGEVLTHQVSGLVLMTLGILSRNIPPSALEERVQERAEKIEEASGRTLGRRALRDLREEVMHEMLPNAFVTRTRINGYLDTEQFMFYVDTASMKVAETFVSELRMAVGSFPVMPIKTAVSVPRMLTGWAGGEPLPEGLFMGDEAELCDPVEDGAVAKLQRHDLRCDEVDKHLEAGKQVARMALVHADRIAFVLDEKMILRKLKFRDAAVEPLAELEKNDLSQEIDASCAVLAGELRLLWPVLAKAFEVLPIEPQTKAA